MENGLGETRHFVGKNQPGDPEFQCLSSLFAQPMQRVVDTRGHCLHHDGLGLASLAELCRGEYYVQRSPAPARAAQELRDLLCTAVDRGHFPDSVNVSSV